MVMKMMISRKLLGIWSGDPAAALTDTLPSNGEPDFPFPDVPKPDFPKPDFPKPDIPTQLTSISQYVYPCSLHLCYATNTFLSYHLS